MTVILVATAILLILAVLVVISTWTFQEKIAFQPERPPYPEPAGVRRVDYTAEDGQPLFGYVVGDPATARGLIIVFHGNADLAARQIDWCRRLSEETGLAVLVPEYRGYMGLPGRPTYEGSRQDARAALACATDVLGVSRNQLTYYGHSLGSAIASELAVENPPIALILEAPFTSARDMAAMVAGRWFASTLWPMVSRLHFDTIAIVSSIEVPVSVTHGQRDRVVPFHMGKTVFGAARRKHQWLPVPRASHSDIRMVAGEAYWKWLITSIPE